MGLNKFLVGAACSKTEVRMALFEDLLKGGSETGLAVAGAAVLAPTVLPAIGRVLRPVAKAAIKGGLVVYRETLSGVGDAVGDIVAEARAELQSNEQPSGADRSEARRRGTPA
jgi:hypothetical protein